MIIYTDCIVAGAGIAGCTLAKKLAEAGFRTHLVDIRSAENIGSPWEITVENSVFARIGLRKPEESLCLEKADVVRYYANNMQNFIEISSEEDDELTIRHKDLNLHLLRQALGAGAVFLGKHVVTGFCFSRDNVTGITGYYRSFLRKEKPFKIKSSIVIDASGTAAVLRRQAPGHFMIKNIMRKQDYSFGWQELREVSTGQMEELREKSGIVPGMSYTRLGKRQAYEVLHLRKNNTASLIFGGAFERESTSAKSVCEEYLKRNPYFGKKIYGGGRLIPIRRSIDNMVGNGFLCIGDCACQVIPTMGSGAASSMHAADIAVRSICEAFNRNNLTRAGLWSYNHKYQTKRGAVLASYDIIRRFIQSLSVNEMDEIFKMDFFKNKNFVNTISSNTINFDILEILENIGKLFGNIKMIPMGIHFLQTLSDSKKAVAIYKNFPGTSRKKDFIEWQKQTNQLFSHYRTFSSDQKDEFF